VVGAYVSALPITDDGDLDLIDHFYQLTGFRAWDNRFGIRASLEEARQSFGTARVLDSMQKVVRGYPGVKPWAVPRLVFDDCRRNWERQKREGATEQAGGKMRKLGDLL